MADQTIICPQCRASIPLTEAISHQIRETTRKELETETARKIQAEREKILREASEKAKEQVTLELTDLRRQNTEKERKLEENQKLQLELLAQKRDLENRQKSLELDVARRIDQERMKMWEEASKKFQSEYHLKDLEKDKMISDLRRQAEDLKRRVELGSQQNQGEVVELELESLLRSQFPFDQIEPVAKGIRGADVLQRVHNKNGQLCGTIIWESKQTKAWSDGWIEKLKDDQRSVRAELAVLLTTALPKGVATFGFMNGIWITNQSCIAGLATALRISLIQLQFAKVAAIGKSEKMEALYNYLMGTEFRQRVEAIVETSISMKDQLDREKRAMQKLWAEREKQIDRIENHMIGMHGDLKGLGAALPQIKSLELDSKLLFSETD